MRGEHQSIGSSRLRNLERIVSELILVRQNPITGLISTGAEGTPDAWVRDNVYSILSVWGLSLAFRKSSDSETDRAKTYELERSVVRLMRGVLKCFMLQREKLEKFKITQQPMDSLHAKYDSRTCGQIVADDKWGHLQIDSVSLYLLMLAQMTASGLEIIQTLDEVAFIQNLIFYIEAAYRIPDYGIWERGDKTNHGLPELNSSSVGMALAACEALDGLNLFGAQGGNAHQSPSLVLTMPDETAMCRTVLTSLLPRESSSKEVDSAVFSVISFPAFSVDDRNILALTRREIITKLEGRFGFKRFLRDGYKTAREDPNRLHYEPHELKVFEGIECDWPMFFAYLALDCLFVGDNEAGNGGEIAKQLLEKLEAFMVPFGMAGENQLRVVPELYYVPAGNVSEEYRQPGSQNRLPAGKVPHLWGQSLYVLARLVVDELVSPGELDPLNRRLIAQQQRHSEAVTQIVLLAEDEDIKARIKAMGVTVQTAQELAPYHVHRSRVLSFLFSYLGKNRRLGLSGRASSEVGVLATSKLYVLDDQIFAFMPSFLDQRVFYLNQDVRLLIDMFATTVAYLNQNWHMVGRPTVIVTISHRLLDGDLESREMLIATLRNLQSGLIYGHRVQVGTLKEFISTSCVTPLSFLEQSEDFTTKSLQKFINLQGSHGAINRLVTQPNILDTSDLQPIPPLVRRKSVVVQRVSGVAKRRQSVYQHSGGHAHSINIPGTSEADRPKFAALMHQDSTVPVNIVDLIAASNESLMDHDEPSAVRPSQHLARPSSSSLSIAQNPNASSSYNDFGLSSSPTFPKDGGLLAGLSPSSHRSRANILASYPSPDSAGVSQLVSSADLNELTDSLRETTDINVQADVIHCLYLAKGLQWETPLGCTVKDLLAELGDRAAECHEWWLVRHAAGILQRRPEDLAKVVTELLVRGKQVSVGLPPEPNEKVITRPIPPEELESLIVATSNNDPSMSVLTTELLVYLSMLIKSDPSLFGHMLRLRVGLITQVMASELGTLLACTPEHATESLFNLSPYQMKTLLFRVLSGSELAPQDRSRSSLSVGQMVTARVSKRSVARQASQFAREMASTDGASEVTTGLSTHVSDKRPSISSEGEDDDLAVEEIFLRGQWVRRRRLDGSLNRVPVGFYAAVWRVLERCDSLLIYGKYLPSILTREMTQHELKFALQVEATINHVPDPAYRQLFVEALSVLAALVEVDHGKTSFGTICVDRLIAAAAHLFLEDQRIIPDSSANGCCLKSPSYDPLARDRHLSGGDASVSTSQCRGPAGICSYFYDTAPSGRFGTLAYLARATALAFNLPLQQNSDAIDCAVS